MTDTLSICMLVSLGAIIYGLGVVSGRKVVILKQDPIVAAAEFGSNILYSVMRKIQDEEKKKEEPKDEQST